MKKSAILILSISLIMFLFSCGNKENNKNKEETTRDSIKEEVVEVVTAADLAEMNKNLPYFKVKVRFDMVALSTSGALFVFREESGESIQFIEKDTPKELKDITKGITPNEYDSKFDDIWFNVEYQKQQILQYDGGLGKDVVREVNVITSIEQIGGKTASSKGITFDEINNAGFFGTSSNWTLQFKKNDIVYIQGYGGETSKAYYYTTEKMTKISDNQVQIKFLFDRDRGFIQTATITKEACSDGESDMVHGYSISVTWEGGRVETGCGHANKK